MPKVSAIRPVLIPIPTAQVNQTKSNLQVCLEFFKDKGKDVAKVIGYSCDWMNQLIPDMPSNVQVISGGMKNTKNFFSALELPEKALKFQNAVVTLFSDATMPVVQKVRNFVKESTGLFNAVADTTELTSQFFSSLSGFAKSVKTINLGATFLGAGNSALENLQKLADTKADEQEKKTFYMLNIARDVSYFVFSGTLLGCMGAVFAGWLAAGAVVSPAVILGLLTSGLVFTIGGFFYEKKVDPENKGMNIPQPVIDNFKREVAQRRLAAAPAA